MNEKMLHQNNKMNNFFKVRREQNNTEIILIKNKKYL